MTWTAFGFLMTGVLLNAAAQLLLKAGTNAIGVITLTRDNWTDTLGTMATENHFITGIILYGVSVIVWIIGLSRVPVSIAYPMLSLGYVINAIAAHYLLGEAVTVARWLGIGFIIIGVWLVARS
ncbi:MAG TPA: EamA family transporter [Casimicrobiaceae bacterium]|jgi:drug/metabolite transporter (DMT)-like permease